MTVALMRRVASRAGVAAACALAVMLAGCAGSGSGSTGEASSAAQFSGIAIPDGYSLDRSETLVLGEGERWTGRLVYTINASAIDMFDFFRRQMPTFGWSEIALVRARTSVLTFSSATTGRIATVEVEPRQWWPWGSRITFIIAPLAGATTTATGDSRPPASSPMAAPRPVVEAAPLQ